MALVVLLAIVLLLVAVVAVVGIGVASAVRSKRQLDDAHQIVPGVRSAAPSAWAGAHTTEAKLHRRLGAAVRSAQANPRFVRLGLAPQVSHIEAEAMAIGERLIAAAALPDSHRTSALTAVERQVVGLEDIVASLVTTTADDDSTALLEQSLAEADVKLDALAKAKAEVDDIDRAARGLAPEAPRDGEDDQPGGQPGTATG